MPSLARASSETFEEREVRLQRARGRESEGSRHQSSQLFNQHSLQMKMKRFHTHLVPLSSSKCSTCLESYPGLQLCSPSTEYTRCYRDKHTPKLYYLCSKIKTPFHITWSAILIALRAQARPKPGPACH